jgi:hypothetical protein
VVLMEKPARFEQLRLVDAVGVVLDGEERQKNTESEQCNRGELDSPGCTFIRHATDRNLTYSSPRQPFSR